MATISGKRFQITDGASSPTNLFPYTVTEAVYGLSTVLANTQSAAVSAAATSAASLYVPKNVGDGATVSGTSTTLLVLESSSSYSAIQFKTASHYRTFGIRANGSLFVTTDNGWSNEYDIYHAGNFNPNDYLPKIGGTLTLPNYTGLNIQTTGGAYSVIRYYGTVDSTITSFGWMGFGGVDNPVIWSAAGYQYSIYHAGNANLNTVKWSCATLNVNRQESTGSVPSGVGLEIQGYSTYVAFKTYTSSGAISTSHLVLDNAGNVGIGKTPQYKLDVAGDINCTGSVSAGSTGGNFNGSSIEFKTASSSNFGGYIDFHYAGSTADYTSRIIEDASGRLSLNSTLYITGGNVGIGTSSPSNKLHVVGASGWTGRIVGANSITCFAHSSGYGFSVDSTSSSSSIYLLGLWYGQSTLGTGGTSAFYVRADGNVGIGTSTPGVKLDVKGQMRSTAIYFTDLTSDIGYIGKGTTTNNHVYLGSYNNGHIILLPNGTGNVGIGTASPASKLHVYSATDETLRLSRVASYTAGSGPMITFRNGETGEELAFIQGAFDTSSQGNYANLYFGTRTSDALGAQTKMVIRYDGNVGIGTSTPAYKLDVNGQVRASRFLTGATDANTADYSGLARGSAISSSLTDNDGAMFYSGHKLWVWATEFRVGGTIVSTGDQVISSDAALKKNWREVGYGIEEIANCTVGRFDWKDGHGTSVGSKAQDWLPLVPELVHGEEGNMTLAYGQIALVNSILLAKHETEQDKEIARLKARVKELETRLNIS